MASLKDPSLSYGVCLQSKCKAEGRSCQCLEEEVNIAQLTLVRNCHLSFKYSHLIDFMLSKWTYVSIIYINFGRKGNTPGNIFISFVSVNEIFYDHIKDIQDIIEFSHLIFISQLSLYIIFLYRMLKDTFMTWCILLLQLYIIYDYKVLVKFMINMRMTL